MQEIEFVPCTSSREELEVEWGWCHEIFRFIQKGHGSKNVSKHCSTEMDWFLKKSEKRKTISSTVTLPTKYWNHFGKALSEYYSQKQHWCFWGLCMSLHLAVFSCTTLFLEMWLSAIFWSFERVKLLVTRGWLGKVHLDEWICVLHCGLGTEDLGGWISVLLSVTWCMNTKYLENIKVSECFTFSLCDPTLDSRVIGSVVSPMDWQGSCGWWTDLGWTR